MTTRKSAEPTVSRDIEINDTGVLLQVLGPNDAYVKLIKKSFRIKIWLRGNLVKLAGGESGVRLAEKVLGELEALARKGKEVGQLEVTQCINMVGNQPNIDHKALRKSAVRTGVNRKTVTPKGAAQQAYMQAIEENDVTFGIGSAGSGKSFVAMAMAISAVLDNKYKKIILTRPTVEAGEKLGFLPGGLEDKINPYLRPLFDAMEDLLDREKATEWMQKGIVEVAPLAFMRGRTLSNAFIILDEAQNTTCEQMKMFLTRIGFGSKAVITGDMTQSDIEGRRNGLMDAVQLLHNTESVYINRFTDIDVVRHPLVQRIVRVYDARDERRQKEREAENGPKG
jgi:phosphate starvation-inducible PhoH-like protein